MPTTKRTNDDDLLALIAASDELHRGAPPMGLDEAGRERASALADQIIKTIPVTLAGVLALLEYTDWEDDPATVSAVTGLRAIVEREAIQEPPILPPHPTALQKLIHAEWHVRSLGVRLSDRADDFKFWEERQDESVQKLVADVNEAVAEVEALADRISEIANALFEKINETPPVTSLADVITLLELGDPPIDTAIAALRAIAEKGEAA